MPKIKIELPIEVLNEWARIANERKEPTSKTIAEFICQEGLLLNFPTKRADEFIKTRKINCDCDAVFERTGTLKQVRKQAKKEGWYYSRFTRWVCPACQKEQHNEWVGMVQGEI